MRRRRRRRVVEVETVVEVVVIIIAGCHGMDCDAHTHAARELLGDVSGIGWTSKDAGFKLRAANILIAWNEISPVVLQSYSTVQSCGLGRFNGYFPPITSGGVG